MGANCHLPFEKIILQQSQENGVTLLNMSFRHIVKTAALPFHHRDPFDRLIAAQALEEKMQLLSCDVVFDEYGVKRVW